MIGCAILFVAPFWPLFYWFVGPSWEARHLHEVAHKALEYPFVSSARVVVDDWDGSEVRIHISAGADADDTLRLWCEVLDDVARREVRVVAASLAEVAAPSPSECAGIGPQG